ncbi:MAG: glutamine-hydrolyzing carbamoyl-phosphate synthase small subunit [Victivallales bacterium]|jgi:carbamoyl-phosphate synthase small subunit|nr:glutamine-hydrolyzing carbamoyl-phosphate synthase small subunit [Victivallales bacterium]
MYHWKQQRERAAFLALANGAIFRGWSFGAPIDTTGEAVFNTGMSGYQEILTDPSYTGQFVTLTAPEIGNYGCNPQDVESRGLFLNGLIIHELNEPSNFRSEISLAEYLKSNGKPGIAGVDTRRLTLMLRDEGSMKAYLHVSDEPITEAEAVKRARDWEGLDGQDYAAKVTTSERYNWNEEGEFKVVAFDYGIKYNILRGMAENGMRVTVLPGTATVADALALAPNGVFLSNGPADPAALHYAIKNIRELIGKVPLFGICLGHQLFGIASGAECGRLKFGHHGCNHPVRNLLTGKVEITSQNHNFALKEDTLPGTLEITHMNLNDNTIEGIRHKTEPAAAVQFHPEAGPGPNDAVSIFRDFRKLMER